MPRLLPSVLLIQFKIFLKRWKSHWCQVCAKWQVIMCVWNRVCRKARFAELRKLKGQAICCRFGPPLCYPCLPIGFSYLEVLGYRRAEICCNLFWEEVSSCKVRLPEGELQGSEARIFGLAGPAYRICRTMMGPYHLKRLTPSTKCERRVFTHSDVK